MNITQEIKQKLDHLIAIGRLKDGIDYTQYSLRKTDFIKILDLLIAATEEELTPALTCSIEEKVFRFSEHLTSWVMNYKEHNGTFTITDIDLFNDNFRFYRQELLKFFNDAYCYYNKSKYHRHDCCCVACEEKKIKDFYGISVEELVSQSSNELAVPLFSDAFQEDENPQCPVL